MAVDRRWPKGVYVREIPSIDGKIYAQVTVGPPGCREVHIAGTLPFDEHQVFIGEGDVAIQTRVVMEHIGRSLAEFGLGPDDVLRTKTYVTDMQDYLANGQPEWNRFFGGEGPCSTTVEISAFADSRALVEIEAYAALPER